MKDMMIKSFIFVAGAAIGSVITWKVLETKYQQRIEEEVESVKAAYANANSEQEDSDEEETDEEDEEADPDGLRSDVKSYASILANSKYTEEIIEEVEDTTEYIYVIPPDALGDCDYEIVSLTYYADKVLTDDMNEPIEGADYIIGSDALNHFGEYEHDSVCIRNDKLKRDYEILLDEDNYADVIKGV